MTRFVQSLLLVAAVAAIIIAFRAGDSGLRPPNRRTSIAPFRLAAIAGPAWSVDDQRGSVVLLNFWATWCPPCRAETPDLVSLAHTYGSRGLRIAGISMDDEPNAVVPAFVSEYRVPYPILIPNDSLPMARTIAALPTTVLLDRQGRIARTYRGARSAEGLAVDIERLLAEKP